MEVWHYNTVVFFAKKIVFSVSKNQENEQKARRIPKSKYGQYLIYFINMLAVNREAWKTNSKQEYKTSEASNKNPKIKH